MLERMTVGGTGNYATGMFYGREKERTKGERGKLVCSVMYARQLAL